MSNLSAGETITDTESGQPAPDSLQWGVEALFRHADGEELLAMMAGLKVLAGHAGVHLPNPDPEGVVRPRLVQVPSKELRSKKKALIGGFNVHDPRLAGNLVEHLPEVNEARDVVAAATRLHVSTTNEHYLSLLLTPEDEQEVRDERTDIWNELEIMGNTGELHWNEHRPQIQVIRFGAEVPKSVAEHTEAYIRKRLPMDLTLEPLYDPIAHVI